MAYTIFALKWRPQNFDEIIGQPHIVTTLRNALNKNRLAQAYLFAGPRGVGKTSTARILAKTLNCNQGPSLNPCQQCVPCKEISQGRSLDVIEIDGASNRGIEEIRTLRENVKFSPVQGKYKIYIIDEVHMLTEPAFNALLKTLEEPPEYVKFIFATTNPDKIPLTILSRCQRFDFRRIPLMEIIAQLERIVSVEHIEIEKDVLFAIAKASDGALRDAESLLDQIATLSQGRVSLVDVISILGLIEQNSLFEITDSIIRKDANAVLRIFNDLIDNGKDTAVFLNNLIEHFRNLMVAKITKGDPRLIDLPDDIRERLLTQAQLFRLEELFSIFNTLVNTQEIAKRLDSLRIPLEIALIKLSHDKKEIDSLSHSVKPAEVKKDPGEKQNTFSTEKTKKEDDSSEDHIDPITSLTLEDIKKIWKDLLDALSKIKMSVATYLSEGSIMDLEKRILVIGFPTHYKLHKESLEIRENKTIIEKILSELTQTNLRIKFILSQDIAKENTEEESFLKSALQTFNGRVIKKE